MASQKCVYMGFCLLLCLGLCTSRDQNKQQDMMIESEGPTWSLKVAAKSRLSVPNGYGCGQGSGTGTGTGSGGVGVGSGSGTGSGNGVGSGYGHGEGRGTGSGSNGGSGYGEGHGYGSGDGYPQGLGCIGGYNCPIVTHCGNCGSPVVVPYQPCQVQGGPMAHKSSKEGEPMALGKSNESSNWAQGEPVHHEAQEPAMKNGEMHH